MGWDMYVLGFSQNDLLHSMDCGNGEPFFVENTIGGKRVWCKREKANPNAAAAASTYRTRDDVKATIKGAVFTARRDLVNGKNREIVFLELERKLLDLLDEVSR